MAAPILDKKNRQSKGGSGSEVYIVTFNGKTMIGKKFNCDPMNASDMKIHMTEVGTLCSLNHPRLVPFCAHFENPFLVVMDHHAKGNLSNFLKANPSVPLNQKKDFAIQIAEGMKYLHSLEILHRDLKCPNILMVDDKTVKITDYSLGMLKKYASNYSRNGSFGVRNSISFLYCAPELGQAGIYTKECDTYSFGIILFEMAVGKLPFESMEHLARTKKIGDGSRDKVPTTVPGDWKVLIQLCWAHFDFMRPSFGQIFDGLNDVKTIEALGRYLMNREDAIEQEKIISPHGSSGSGKNLLFFFNVNEEQSPISQPKNQPKNNNNNNVALGSNHTHTGTPPHPAEGQKIDPTIHFSDPSKQPHPAESVDFYSQWNEFQQRQEKVLETNGPAILGSLCKGCGQNIINSCKCSKK